MTRRLTLTLALILGACSSKPARVDFGPNPGAKGDSNAQGDNSSANGGKNVAAALTCDPLDDACLALQYPDGGCSVKPGEKQQGLRTLTNEEIKNTLSYALNIDVSKEMGDMPRRDQGTKFQNSALLTAVDQSVVDAWMNVATNIAKDFIANDSAFNMLAPCKDANAACGLKFAQKFGPLLLRAPLSDDDLKPFVSVFTAGAAISFKEGATRLVLAFMIDPRFLFRIEEGADNGATASTVELANRLSFFLWRSGPDAALLAKAKDGTLSKTEVYSAEVDRMLADPKAEVAFRQFMVEWLLLNNSDNLQIPMVNIPTVQMREDVLKAAVDNMFYNKGDFRKAFGKDSNVNLLTMPGVLAGTNVSSLTSPVKRGLFVSRRLLCRNVPQPPKNAGAFKADVGTAMLTPRDKLKLHEDNASCKACHGSVDPIGLGLENYDALGKSRDMYDDLKVAIDTSGTIRLNNQNVSFANSSELLSDFSGSTDLASCATVTVAEYAFGGGPDSGSACEMSSIQESFLKSGFQWKALLKAVTLSQSFNARVKP